MTKTEEIVKAIELIGVSVNDKDEPSNVVDGLFAIAGGLAAVARALERLGTHHALTDMGANEVLAKEIKEGLAFVSSSLSESAGSGE